MRKKVVNKIRIKEEKKKCLRKSFEKIYSIRIAKIRTKTKNSDFVEVNFRAEPSSIFYNELITSKRVMCDHTFSSGG